jgi:hypothetical protein
MHRFTCEYFSAVKFFEWMSNFAPAPHSRFDYFDRLVSVRFDWVCMGEL